jgi:hypothetical protein
MDSGVSSVVIFILTQDDYLSRLFYQSGAFYDKPFTPYFYFSSHFLWCNSIRWHQRLYIKQSDSYYSD